MAAFEHEVAGTCSPTDRMPRNWRHQSLHLDRWLKVELLPEKSPVGTVLSFCLRVIALREMDPDENSLSAFTKGLAGDSRQTCLDSLADPPCFQKPRT
jgi:hypothetical protein